MTGYPVTVIVLVYVCFKVALQASSFKLQGRRLTFFSHSRDFIVFWSRFIYCSPSAVQAAKNPRGLRAQGMSPNHWLAATLASADLRGIVDMNREYKMTIAMIPDEVMLDIFDFIRIINFSELGPHSYAWKWERLAHVCRRWRQIVFASPLRLHIQLLCKRGTPVRTHLSCWPASFPIAIDFHDGLTNRLVDEENAIAALEHPSATNRVCLLNLLATPYLLEKLATVAREPLPALTRLQLSLSYLYSPVLLDRFLPVGGSPCLQELFLDAISFKDLPEFIHAARDLVTLHLSRMLESRWLSPAGMALCLSPLTKLRFLFFGFETYISLPDRPTRAPAIRAVLPALTSIHFDYACNYVEDLVSQIDCPRLNYIRLRYPHDSFVSRQDFQIFNFIDRSEDSRLTLFNRVTVDLVTGDLYLKFWHESHFPIFFWFEDYNWRDLSVPIIQVFSQFSNKLSNVRHFSINSREQVQGLGISRTDWVLVLHSFTSLQTLRVSSGDVKYLALALDEETALLPALDLLCLEGGSANSGVKFLEDRQRSVRPVTIVKTLTEFRKILRAYLRE